MEFCEAVVVQAIARIEDERLWDRRAPITLRFEKYGTRPVGLSLLHDGDFFGRPTAAIIILDRHQAINDGQATAIADRKQPVRCFMGGAPRLQCHSGHRNIGAVRAGLTDCMIIFAVLFWRARNPP